MKKKRITNNNIVIIIPVIAIIVAIIAFMAFYLSLNKKKDVKDAIGESNTPTTAVQNSTGSTDKASYFDETNYKGELSEYPELYQIPFKKTDNYIRNKEFSTDHSEIFSECEEDATQFMEALFNVDYRKIVEDKSAYDSNIMLNCDYMAYKTLNWDSEEENTIYFFDYIQDITNYFVTNMVEMEAKFYTDDSLVYSDYYTFVRGELVFTIYETKDSESVFEIGKEYKIPMEVAMQRSKDNFEDRTIVSFGRAEDNTFFLNP